jgi:hypothetical protein
MELSRAVASIAVVLGVILAAGHAIGDGATGSSAPKQTIQQKVDEREAQRRAEVQEQRKRKEEYARACNKPLKTDAELDLCRAAYKRLEAGKL